MQDVGEMKQPTVCSLLRETAEALTANDPARLARLGSLAAQMRAAQIAQTVQMVQMNVKSEDRAQILRTRNLLDGTLRATASNLRLLRRVGVDRGAEYEAFRA